MKMKLSPYWTSKERTMEILIGLLIVCLIVFGVYHVKEIIKYEHKIGSDGNYIVSLQKDNDKMTELWFKEQEQIKLRQMRIDELNEELLLCNKRIEELQQPKEKPLEDVVKGLYNLEDEKERKNFEDLTNALNWNGEQDV